MNFCTDNCLANTATLEGVISGRTCNIFVHYDIYIIIRTFDLIITRL